MSHGMLEARLPTRPPQFAYGVRLRRTVSYVGLRILRTPLDPGSAGTVVAPQGVVR